MHIAYDDLAGSVGTDLGTSRPYVVGQAEIDTFADLTHDHQWIHVDRVLAAKSDFGGTIAHGYLTLSFVAPVISELLVVRNSPYAVNYGLNRVRFPAPTPSGSALSGSARIIEATAMDGCVQVVIRVEMRTPAVPKPVCVADSVLRFFGAPPNAEHDVRTHPAYH